MDIDKLFSALRISASGLSAERLRMNVIAENIANASATRTPQGGPYRRQMVVFSSVLADTMGEDRAGADDLGGVEAIQVVQSTEPFNRVYIPGHPDANKDGYVLMPNVNTMFEMIDMISASRSYEANLAVIRTFKEMMARTLAIAR